jgi:hypothetical protein
MKYFSNAVATIRENPLRTSVKVAEIQPYTIVEHDGESHSGWLRIKWGDKAGWVADTLVEPYVENLPTNCVKIDDQTPDLYDFEQYIILNGIKQTNLCGELCVCLALDIPLKELMNVWQIKAPSLWSRIKGGGKFSGTHWQDLNTICTLFGVNAKPLAEVMKDPYLKRSRYTLNGIKTACEHGYPIAGVKMDGNTGRLRGQGTGHWIVIMKIDPERFGGIVTIYNPAPNRIEQYSYPEFLASAVEPFGLYIPKG